MATKPRIPVAEALRDLRSGMDDSALMQKYRLSPQGLQSLLRQLIERGCITKAEIEQRMPAAGASVSTPVASREATSRRMNPAELIRDVRAGMHDFDLMAKYQISSRKFETLLGDLVRSGLLEQSDVDLRKPGGGQGVKVHAHGASAGAEDAGECDESKVIELTWECPVCGIYQSRSYAKCPECGALVALLTRKRPT